MNKYSVGIHVLIKKRGKFLLIKRTERDDEDPGCWDLPGGGINTGEQPINAALREAKEEAGVNIKVAKIIAVWGMPYKDCWSVELIAEGEYLSGKITLSPEHSDFRWVDNQELTLIEPKSIHVKALFEHKVNEG